MLDFVFENTFPLFWLTKQVDYYWIKSSHTPFFCLTSKGNVFLLLHYNNEDKYRIKINLIRYVDILHWCQAIKANKPMNIVQHCINFFARPSHLDYFDQLLIKPSTFRLRIKDTGTLKSSKLFFILLVGMHSQTVFILYHKYHVFTGR